MQKKQQKGKNRPKDMREARQRLHLLGVTRRRTQRNRDAQERRADDAESAVTRLEWANARLRRHLTRLRSKIRGGANTKQAKQMRELRKFRREHTPKDPLLDKEEGEKEEGPVLSPVEGFSGLSEIPEGTLQPTGAQHAEVQKRRSREAVPSGG